MRTDQETKLAAELMTKVALNMGGVRSAASRVGGSFAHATQGALATAGATAAVTGVGMAASKVWDAITKKHDFHNMLHEGVNEDIKAHYAANPALVNTMFTSLRTANPAFSRDPMIAGNYLRRMLDNPGSAGAHAELAAQARGNMPSVGMDAFTRGAMEGAKSFGQEGFSQKLKQPNFDREFAQRDTQHAEKFWQGERDARQRQDQFDWSTSNVMNRTGQGQGPLSAWTRSATSLVS